MGAARVAYSPRTTSWTLEAEVQLTYRSIGSRSLAPSDASPAGSITIRTPIPARRNLPSIEAVAKALASSANVKLQPSGAYAANLLGLSEQVPAKVVFLTSGRARKVKLGKLVIELWPAAPRKMAAAGRTSGLVLAALRYLGKEHITPERIAHLRKILSSEDRKRLLTDLPSAPAWLHSHIRAIAVENSK